MTHEFKEGDRVSYAGLRPERRGARGFVARVVAGASYVTVVWDSGRRMAINPRVLMLEGAETSTPSKLSELTVRVLPQGGFLVIGRETPLSAHSALTDALAFIGERMGADR